MKKNELKLVNYVSPEVSVIEINAKSVLCQSVDVDGISIEDLGYDGEELGF